MSARIVILRHAETKLDLTTPAENWLLTDEGMKKSQDLADTGVFDNVDRIFTSNEYKTLSTALPIAERLDLEITQIPSLSELYRGSSPLLSNEEYILRIDDILAFPPKQVEGWEHPEDALQRFTVTIEDISNEGTNILVVSHGLVISLYFTQCLGQRDIAFERWKKLSFLSWGIVSNGKIVKDIV
ncbi:MAG: histidine phosphatase family protein [Candidatus Thorarchaeota archaeon]|jgi:broad specificity phosphatase PhoE